MVTIIKSKVIDNDIVITIKEKTKREVHIDYELQPDGSVYSNYLDKTFNGLAELIDYCHSNIEIL